MQIWTGKLFNTFLIFSKLVTKRKRIRYARYGVCCRSWETISASLEIQQGLLLVVRASPANASKTIFGLHLPADSKHPRAFLWFTGGTGWGMYEMLVKATSYNMPLATAVASNFSNYGKLPLAYDMMLYWWVPDPTFLRPWLLKLD